MEGELISTMARTCPNKAAVIEGGSGRRVSFAAFEARSNQVAHFLRSRGLADGDAVGLCLENGARLLEIAWGILRAGLTLVPVSNKLTAAEIAYIVRDSGSSLLITSASIGAAYSHLPSVLPDTELITTAAAEPPFMSLEAETAAQPTTTLPDERLGIEMLYSSGTTGRPKGIRYQGIAGQPLEPNRSAMGMIARLGIGSDTVFLSPAPLYHSAPLGWTLATLRIGGTVVVMERFDAEQALRLIDEHRVTLSQWVPTHFVRMLKLPEEVRRRYDTSSLRLAIHAAAPCPVPIKRQMIDWFGPIVFEYFGSSEQTALTSITSQEWLAHPGSVGRCILGKLHICDDDGNVLPPGAPGLIYSEGGMGFAYHDDPARTAETRNAKGWTTVGDIGFVDEDGWLFLTDRKNFMIITGGVNVYPQEVENLLVTHPKVADAAVIGTPDVDLGERVTAIIETVDPRDATPEFASELQSWMRDHLSGVKVPKRIEFRRDLPRLPTGKMQKFVLKQEYSQ